MATPNTITIKDTAGTAKTFPAPTEVNPYPPPALAVFTPADGVAVVQGSGSRGNTGDKAGIRSLVWNALPSAAPTGYSFTGTLAILKALEGKQTEITLGALFGGVYSTAQAVTVLEVRPRYLGKAGGTSWWATVLEFLER